MVAVGLDPAAACQILPEWWEDAIGSRTGLVEIRGVVAKHFGLRIGQNGVLAPRVPADCRFKVVGDRTEEQVAPVRAFVSALAQLVATATLTSWAGAPSAAGDLRAGILARPGQRWVDFAALVNVCWENGVPVLYLPALPVSSPKMDALVTLCGERPVIVLTRKAGHSAWLLFILAHEIGHLGRGHLTASGFGSIVDGEVAEDGAGDDVQEQEANTYALELLTGRPDLRLRTERLMPGPVLAEAAERYGLEHRIDPGHLVLNFARAAQSHDRNYYTVANAALKYLPDQKSVQDLCQDALRAHIDPGRLPDDSAQVLGNVGLL